jgi:glycosyltransferase involved in cell wall biosynthesis
VPAYVREEIARLDAGRAGLLVPARDEAAMAESILQLLKDRDGAKKLGDVARERAHGVFDIRIVARQLEKLYEQSLG